MLFDERPKYRREDLYDREREVEEIKRSIGNPLILITGIRRIGKTSVLNVALSELDLPKVLIDARSLPQNYGVRELYGLLADSLASSLDKFKEVLMRLKGVRVMGYGLELSWRGRDFVSLSELFDALNRRGGIIAIDEAQNLRGPKAKLFLEALAHAYDYDRSLTFILTGSEVGLLYSFLAVDDSKSPLYGRYYKEVKLERFSREESMDFLVKGFEESGIKPSNVDRAVDLLDGIPGWLTFYGRRCLDGECDPERIMEMAASLALRELSSLLKGRSRRHFTVLKAIANGMRSWSQVKRYVEEVEGKSLSKGILYNVLKSLEGLSILKDYRFLDPVYEEAAKRVKLNEI